MMRTCSMSVNEIYDLLLALLLDLVREDVDDVRPDRPLSIGVQDREDLYDQPINVPIRKRECEHKQTLSIGVQTQKDLYDRAINISK